MFQSSSKKLAKIHMKPVWKLVTEYFVWADRGKSRLSSMLRRTCLLEEELSAVARRFNS